MGGPTTIQRRNAEAIQNKRYQRGEHPRQYREEGQRLIQIMKHQMEHQGGGSARIQEGGGGGLQAEGCSGWGEAEVCSKVVGAGREEEERADG